MVLRRFLRAALCSFYPGVRVCALTFYVSPAVLSPMLLSCEWRRCTVCRCL